MNDPLRMDYYVYALCDPRHDFGQDGLMHRPFYIGKGTGRRALIHLKESAGLRKPVTKYALRTGARNHNALSWQVTTPDGVMHEVFCLREWCEKNGLRYSTVYHSAKGYKSERFGTGKGGRQKNV